MKRLSIIVVVLICTTAAVAAGAARQDADTGLYGRRIVLDAGAVPKVTFADRLHGCIVSPGETADELAGWLDRICGKKFDIETAPSGTSTAAIFLSLADSMRVTAADRDRLRDKGLEAFIIRGDASQLQIIANDLRGLTHGAYFYLEQLGVRWLMAGANWTVTPARRDITLTVDRLVEPAFFARGYSGTGGFYSWYFGRRYTGSEATRKKGIAEFETDWTAWSRRLRNGGQSLGHAMGEGFIADKKVQAVLKAHPDYLAKINGAHAKLFVPAFHGAGKGQYVWSQSAGAYVPAAPPGTGTHDLNVIAKLNAGNPAAVELYCNWILEQLRIQRSGPQGYAVQTMSVEPSDGDGEGNNYEELAAQGVGDGSESDQEFYIANYCARRVRAEFPGVSVVMLAYAQRSDPPTFPLEPNFIVQPAFAFRHGRKNAGLSNEEWIDVWKAKAQNMAVYDYWSIPDWSHDEPTFNYLDLAKKLREFHGNHIRGIMAESTFSGGAMGIGQYLASHLMWDLTLDDRALLEDWYQAAFGPALPPMKRMLERWARGYHPISSELGVSYADVDEAERLAAGDPAVLARVDDYARYLHYLRLRNELLNASDAAEKDRKTIALAEHLFNINESRMVHTTRNFDLARSPAAMAEFHLHDPGKAGDPPDGPGWARVHRLSHAEVVALLADGMARYPQPDFTVRSFMGNLVPVSPIVWQPPTGDPWGPAMPVSSAAVELEMPAGLAAFPLRVSRLEDNKISVTNSSGQTVYRHIVTMQATDTSSKWTWDEMSIPLAPGHYQVHFAGKNGKLGLFHFQTYKGVPLVLRTFQAHKGSPSPRLYFYVPHGLRKIAIFFPYTNRGGGFETPFYLPDGRRAQVEERDGGKLLVAPVPPGQDGKVWSLDRLVQPYQNFETLNFPQVFSLAPELLLVPSDAIIGGDAHDWRPQ